MERRHRPVRRHDAKGSTNDRHRRGRPQRRKGSRSGTMAEARRMRRHARPMARGLRGPRGRHRCSDAGRGQVLVRHRRAEGLGAREIRGPDLRLRGEARRPGPRDRELGDTLDRRLGRTHGRRRVCSGDTTRSAHRAARPRDLDRGLARERDLDRFGRKRFLRRAARGSCRVGLGHTRRQRGFRAPRGDGARARRRTLRCRSAHLDAGGQFASILMRRLGRFRLRHRHHESYSQHKTRQCVVPND